MNKTAKIWDRFANNYSKKPVPDEAVYQKKLQITRGYFNPDSRVFEFGCGTGSTAINHAPYVQHIDAIDISPKMIEIAKGKVETEQLENINFSVAAIDEFKAEDQSYDAVLGMSILHLLEDKETVIAEVFRMLKPGGVFVSSTVCLTGSMKFFKYLGRLGYFLGLIPFIKVFTPKELMDSITEAGFEIDHQWLPGKGDVAFLVAKKP